jgi:hypothetical protein
LTDPEKNLTINALKFFEVLSKLNKKQLLTLTKYISNQCFVIVVSTQNEETAYRIFSILNDRGLDLSYTDILKAEIIGNLEDELQDSYTEKWETAEEKVGREGFKDVISHIRTIKKQARIKDTILKELRGVIKENKIPSRDFIDQLVVPFSETYITITEPDTNPNSTGLNWSLSWLNRIGNTDWVPVAMLYLIKHSIIDSETEHFFRDLERLAASMLIRRENVNLRQMTYISILKSIESQSDLFCESSPLQLTKSAITSTVEKLNGDIYNNGACLYVLRRLDAELNSNHFTPEFKRISIEHVLPQNPQHGSQWLKWYPDPELRAILVHRLGNLALLSKNKNSSASNFDFDKKKDLYFNNPPTTYALTTQVLIQKDWTQPTFERRQKDNLQILLNVWRFNELGTLT